MKKKFRLKRHDKVLVIAGKDKGKVGEVLSIDKENDRVVISGVNVVVRHKKPRNFNEEGKETKTKSIHVSNVSLFVEQDGNFIPSKVKIVRTDENVRQRILKKTSEVVEEYKYASKS